MSILKVEGISKMFGGLYAVKDISFEANEGEILSIIGPNGAGKSTLFNLITRIYDCTEGKIFFNNKEITSIAPYKLASLGISRTFQNIELFAELSTLENVMVGGYVKGKVGFTASLFGIGSRKEEQRIKRIALEKIQQLDLQAYANLEAIKMPYGRQRMVELARALMTSPKVLLLDEPAAGLNGIESKELTHTLIKLKNEGVCVILIEHDMDTVMDVSDKIIVMNYGEKLAEGTPEEIQKNQKVINAYLGEEVY